MSILDIKTEIETDILFFQEMSDDVKITNSQISSRPCS